MFQQLMILFGAYQASKNIQRYLTGIRVVFGKTFDYPNTGLRVTAPSPAYNRIQIFNSATEALAGRPIGTKAEYIDTRKNPELKNIILPGTVVKELMETKDNPYRYVRKTKHLVFIIWEGKQKVFWYDFNQMLLVVDSTPDIKAYYKFKEAAEFENSCALFVAAAQRNARILGDLVKNQRNLTEAQRREVDIAITKHLAQVNTFKATMPAGFYVESTALKNAQIGEPITLSTVAIIWIVGIIVAGAVVVGVNYLQKKGEVDKQRNVLDNNLQNIKALQDAAAAVNNGTITQGQYNDVRDMTQQNTAANNQNLTTATEAAAAETKSGGFLGQFQNILIISGIIILGKQLLGSNNSK